MNPNVTTIPMAHPTITQNRTIPISALFIIILSFQIANVTNQLGKLSYMEDNQLNDITHNLSSIPSDFPHTIRRYSS